MDKAELVLHTDNMVSDLESSSTMLPEDLDDLFLFSCLMLEVLFGLVIRWLSSRACVHARSLALLFSMSRFTVGEVYVT